MNISEPIFKIFGDHSMLLEFRQEIDEKINREVMIWRNAILHANIPAIMQTIPAYCSLTVHFNPVMTSHKALKEQILKLYEEIQQPKADHVTKMTIPVCYDHSFGMDLFHVARATKLNVENVIALHTAKVYSVFMMGFLPGFAYLGRLDGDLYCGRKKTPRLIVEAGSVGIAGYQTGIYPISSPAGWQIIGRTPILIFNPRSVDPFLFHHGFEVQFKSISKEEYQDTKVQIESGKFEMRKLYE